MKSFLIVFTIVYWLSLYGSSFGDIQYRGHKVHRITPESNDQLRWLKLIERSQIYNADFWTEPRRLGLPVDIQVSPEHNHKFLKALYDQKMSFRTIIEDLERSIIKHRLENSRAKSKRLAPSQYNWEGYHTYEEIMQWIDTRASDCGSRCSVTSIGSTHEGRDLKVIKITNGDSTDKPVFWLDAGIHAREWIAPAVATYFIDRLIQDYGTDSDVQTMLDNYDFYILALMNGDGYDYSHTDDRLWRKSRRPNDDVDSTCVGTDINRNFDHEWGTVGISYDPCSQTYCGSSAYSEVEAEHVANFVQGLSNVKVFYTLHSYGQLWMAPWGYTTDPPNNYDELMRAGQIAADALEAVHGTQYEVGSASEILYASSGTSRDWAKGVPEIEYVYTIELRDDGDYGFLLPPEQIQPTVEETWAGIKAFTLATLNPSK